MSEQIKLEKNVIPINYRNMCFEMVEIYRELEELGTEEDYIERINKLKSEPEKIITRWVDREISNQKNFADKIKIILRILFPFVTFVLSFFIIDPYEHPEKNPLLLLIIVISIVASIILIRSKFIYKLIKNLPKNIKKINEAKRFDEMETISHKEGIADLIEKTEQELQYFKKEYPIVLKKAEPYKDQFELWICMAMDVQVMDVPFTKNQSHLDLVEKMVRCISSDCFNERSWISLMEEATDKFKRKMEENKAMSDSIMSSIKEISNKLYK